MRTYIFTFDVNDGHEIKSGILQMSEIIMKKLGKKETDIKNDKEIIIGFIVRCIQRFIKVNEFNSVMMEDSFWNKIYSHHNNYKKIEVNILSIDEIIDKKDLNKKITDAGNKYDIFVNCCNPDKYQDYFIYQNQQPILLYDSHII